MENILKNLDEKLLAIVRAIGQMADGQGMKAYLVGGPVRDLLLKHPSLDLDITVEGSGIRLAEMFAAKYAGAKVTRYPAFKTATVHLPGGSNRLVDFATARKEIYARPGAFPAVVPSDVRDDLQRRDFTVNAMAIAINLASWGKLMDPFGGMADLRAKRIRVLHDQSFIDDPTRILRAARFKERLGFALAAKTLKLLKAAVQGGALETIKPQRYIKESKKIQQEDKPQHIIKCLQSWNAWKGEMHVAH